MGLFQRYVFRQALWPTLGAIGALALLAVLTQSLTNIDIIAERGETALVFLWVTLLALPQLLALLAPIAVFIGVAMALNRLSAETELTVAAASGMSRRQRLSPLIRLGLYAALLNLAVNMFVQPAAFREMRQAVYDIRTDVAASFMQSGEFTNLDAAVTFYAREIESDGAMRDVFIQDGRGGESTVYAAERGLLTRGGRGLVLVLQDGVFSFTDDNGVLAGGSFDSYTIDLRGLIDPTAAFFFKESDKYLPELLNPSPGEIARARSRAALLAEGHYRLSAPLYNLAFALIAAAAFFASEHNRSGYGRAVATAAAGALILRLAGFGAQAAAADAPALNAMQYVFPLAGALIAGFTVWRPIRRRPRSAPDAPDPTLAETRPAGRAPAAA